MVLRVFNRLRVKHVEKQYAAHSVWTDLLHINVRVFSFSDLPPVRFLETDSQEGQNRMSKQNNREKFAVAQWSDAKQLHGNWLRFKDLQSILAKCSETSRDIKSVCCVVLPMLHCEANKSYQAARFLIRKSSGSRNISSWPLSSNHRNWLLACQQHNALKPIPCIVQVRSKTQSQAVALHQIQSWSGLLILEKWNNYFTSCDPFKKICIYIIYIHIFWHGLTRIYSDVCFDTKYDRYFDICLDMYSDIHSDIYADIYTDVYSWHAVSRYSDTYAGRHSDMQIYMLVWHIILWRVLWHLFWHVILQSSCLV